jgi:hypothetical protein
MEVTVHPLIGVSSNSVSRIFDIFCDPLPLNLPDKKAYLRSHHQQYLIGSTAVFDCLAGHRFENEVYF